MSLLAKAPSWWGERYHSLSILLSPVGFVYGLGVRLRFALTTPYRSKLPVICIGNFTVGGGGKTPLAIEISRLLLETGHKPVFLTRGYGGRLKGPHLVDPSKNSAVDVGDEPLILAQSAPVVVCADRGKGARFIEKLDADVIIMDDGFQNPSLHKDFSLVVIDSVVGVGNSRIFPAGPLRAGLSFQLKKADVLAIVGKGEGAREIEQVFSGDVFHLELKATGAVDWLSDTDIIAVTGIACPGKFYASLEKLGARIVQTHEYPDHHMFREEEARSILQARLDDDMPIVMTQKDWIRLPLSGDRGRLRDAAKVLHVKMTIDETQRLLSRFKKAISFAVQ